FLAACGGAEVLALRLDSQPPAVREVVVLAFSNGGLGAVRGFASDPPDGIREPWTLSGDAADAAEDLLGARLADVEPQDPLGKILRQTPLCDLVPEYDCARRIADLVVRVLALRWPQRY